jgi:hypothetical protein
MRILRLRLLSTGEYRVVVHLDASKIGEDGSYNPADVLEMRWPAKPEGMTHATYLQQERPKIRQICESALAYRVASEGSALPGEGDPL